MKLTNLIAATTIALLSATQPANAEKLSGNYTTKQIGIMTHTNTKIIRSFAFDNRHKMSRTYKEKLIIVLKVTEELANSCYTDNSYNDSALRNTCIENYNATSDIYDSVQSVVK